MGAIRPFIPRYTRCSFSEFQTPIPHPMMHSFPCPVRRLVEQKANTQLIVCSPPNTCSPGSPHRGRVISTLGNSNSELLSPISDPPIPRPPHELSWIKRELRWIKPISPPSLATKIPKIINKYQHSPGAAPPGVTATKRNRSIHLFPGRQSVSPDQGSRLPTAGDATAFRVAACRQRRIVLG